MVITSCAVVFVKSAISFLAMPKLSAERGDARVLEALGTLVDMSTAVLDLLDLLAGKAVVRMTCWKRRLVVHASLTTLLATPVTCWRHLVTRGFTSYSR